MDKQTFLAQLRKSLSGLPERDIEERLTFYSEMIDDRMEEGLSEEEAVAAAGSAQEIAAQILADTPIKEKRNAGKRPKGWEITLLALGSPIWLSLGIAVFAVILSVYVTLWAVLISLWAAFASLAACAVCGIVAGIVFCMGSDRLTGACVIAAGLICAGLSIFLFFGCRAATKGLLILTKKMATWTRSRFIRKGEAQ